MNPEDLLPMARFTQKKKPMGPRTGGGRPDGNKFQKGGFGGGRGGGNKNFNRGGSGGGKPFGKKRFGQKR